MLYTDQVTSKQVVEKVAVDQVVDQVRVEQLVNRPGWVKTYKDLSWFEEVKRRKLLKQKRYKKYRKKHIVNICSEN